MKLHVNRRSFLKKTGAAALFASWTSHYVFATNIPDGYTPLVVGDEDALKGKLKELIVQGNKPWNIETPVHLLDDKVTPFEKMFVRNNGLLPDSIDPTAWTLTIDGESAKKKRTYTIAELKKRFKHYTYQLVLECGGNGRSGFDPPASGNQWGQGAVHCAKWTGVRLKDILKEVGVKDDAVYIGYHAKDQHLSKDPAKAAISRGVPMAKALEDETLIAWAVNGQDIPIHHGFPLRLVVGGWPASVSGKWLSRIAIRNKVHDGAKMDGHSYKVPVAPMQPGEDLKATNDNYQIIESMPVKSLLTYPKTGATIQEGEKITFRGHAWAGDLKVKEVFLSIDFGATWHPCQVEAPVNRLAWQHWNSQLSFPKKGYYEVWVRAVDENGTSQPMLVPSWNPGGYLNNACERIAVKVV